MAFGHGVKGYTGHACATCPHNSRSDPDLFGGTMADEPEAGVCTNEGCFRAKEEIVARDVEKMIPKARAAAKRGRR